jgi:predicted glycosyltransferase
MEQYIRATRAQELGLVRVLVDDGIRDPRTMAIALRDLPQQNAPSSAVVPGLLDGNDNVFKLVQQWLARHRSGFVLAADSTATAPAPPAKH